MERGRLTKLFARNTRTMENSMTNGNQGFDENIDWGHSASMSVDDLKKRVADGENRDKVMLGLINSMGELISGMADRIVFLEGLTKGMSDRIDDAIRRGTIELNEKTVQIDGLKARVVVLEKYVKAIEDWGSRKLGGA
jgi:hypothetical protein